MDLQPIIESARERVLAIKERDGMPGVAIALVSEGRPVWMESFGSTEAEGGRPIDPHTIFSIQSTSKTFTATAVMLAVQQGLLDLGAPITTYLPDFTVQSRYERDPQAKMTLRHLLSHRAGFTHEAPLGGNFDPELESAAPNFEAHVASIADTWLRYPVGQRYAYSNLGIDLAGAALAKVCRAPFAECLKTLIFEPLGMIDSTADAAVYGPRGNRAVGHQPSGAPVPVCIPIEASGGVYSSAADMARFAAFHLGKGAFAGRTILDPALWEAMHTPYFDGVPYALGILRQPLRLEGGEPLLFNHDGGGYGFGACFTYCPEHGLAWIALYNGQLRPGPPAPFDPVGLHEALKASLGPRAPADGAPTSALTLPPDTLAPYVAGLAVARVGWDGEAFGFRLPDDDAPNPLAFTSADRAVVADGPRIGHGVRLHPREGIQPAWLQFQWDDVGSYWAFGSRTHIDLSEGEDAPNGPVGDAYDRFLGDYTIIQWGAPLMTASLTKVDDHLHLGPIRLVEHSRGLLFSADGEALDLSRDPPTFRNIPLHRAQAA